MTDRKLMGWDRPLSRRHFLAIAGAWYVHSSLFPTPSAAACETPPKVPEHFPVVDSLRAPVLGHDGPITPVEIQQSLDTYSYLVNGQPTVIRGMGYNPRTLHLSVHEREAQLSRDFTMMRETAVNTVFGWNPVEFDGLLLDHAAAAGLGVAIPYDIDFNADFRDTDVRARTADEVLQLVSRYRNHPALRLWAIGNETFQRTVPPLWCHAGPSEEIANRARALGDFLVELADGVRMADPVHPVLYREAEDSYAHWLADALSHRPASRPWLVYGINAYNERLSEILDSWHSRGIDSPVLVSEFALKGVERGNRGPAFRTLWAMIRAHSSFVLGGVVYVWYTEGPEAVDLEFGMVGPDGQPVDDALGVISELYHAAWTPE